MTKTYTQKYMREVAHGTARSILREMNCDLAQTPVDDAFAVLDDLTRSEASLIASTWYRNASDNQIRLFKKEWLEMQRRLR